MSQRVSFVSPVALAIWEILQDCRNRVLFGMIRQPDAGRQRRTVFQRYQRVLDNPHGFAERRGNHTDTPRVLQDVMRALAGANLSRFSPFLLASRKKSWGLRSVPPTHGKQTGSC